MKRSLLLFHIFLILAVVLAACSTETPESSATPEPGAAKSTPLPKATSSGIDVKKNITYATPQVNGIPQNLKLDIYSPKNLSEPVPGLVFVVGGGWMEGSKSSCPGNALAKGGYVVACIEYRVVGTDGACSKDAIFPAAVQDVKSAVRWLRKNARVYNVDPDNIGLVGDSAGGHLAVLAGVSKGIKIFNNNQNSGTSDDVQAIADWYGPVEVIPEEIAFTEDACKTKAADLAKLYESNPWFGITLSWSRFLGGSLENNQVLERARQANPITYLDGGDPPILVIHGSADNVVSPEQSLLLSDAMKSINLKGSYLSLPGVGHSFGSASNVNANFSTTTISFFDLYLK